MIWLLDDSGKSLAPTGAQVQFETISGDEIRAAVSYASGAELVYDIQPGSLSVTVHAAAPPASGDYTLQLHSSIRMDSAWVMAGGKPHFLAVTRGAIGGDKQTLVESLRSSALEITCPLGSAQWDVTLMDPWGSDERVDISVKCPNNRSVTLTPKASASRLSRSSRFCAIAAVRIPLHRRAVADVATISSRSLDQAVKLHLSIMPSAIAVGDTVYAALFADVAAGRPGGGEHDRSAVVSPR